MSDDFKAIQTKYKGYHFRSRLEARYAVLFDEMGIEYQYEPEGFELPEGRYLPDFFIYDLGLYLEVKGTAPSQRELDLCLSLSRQTYCDILLCVGELIQEDVKGTSPHYHWEYRRLPPFFAKIITNAPESIGWSAEQATTALERGGIVFHYPKAKLHHILGQLGFDIRHSATYQGIMRSARFEFGAQGI